jgi:hypothetical protein
MILRREGEALKSSFAIGTGVEENEELYAAESL